MGCSKLTSLDLSNFETLNVKKANKLFYGCDKLVKLDISSFKNINLTVNKELFNKNLKSLELTIDQNFYIHAKDIIPPNWKVIRVKNITSH